MSALTKDKRLASSLTELFTEEANDCDHKIITEGPTLCGFQSLNSSLSCCVDKCPLGALVDDELGVKL